MRVLIVDDSPAFLKLTVPLLEKNGYEVVTAGTGKQAVRLLEKHEQIDIILSDVIMPVMSGFHLLHYVKADERLSQIPVILYTSLSDEESVRTGLELGAVDYVIKPFSEATLVEKLRKAETKILGAVLVVDDEQLLRTLLFNMLTRDGLRVLLASNGNEALELLANNKISVVVSDIEMPEMHGLELLVAVKDRYPSLPVVLVTGHSGEYRRENVLAAGADDYITKPFRNADILRQVRRFVR